MFENVISIKDFGKDDIEFILREAEKMEPVASGERSSSVLTGKILGMMFYEPSTRTRLSFETAMKRLGAVWLDLQIQAQHPLPRAKV